MQLGWPLPFFRLVARPGTLLPPGCMHACSGMLDAQLTEGDVVTFISTLHGG